jgi:hypothetical protein
MNEMERGALGDLETTAPRAGRVGVGKDVRGQGRFIRFAG